MNYGYERKVNNRLNKKLLKAKMIIYGDTNESLASAIQLSPQRLSAKINETNGAEFTAGEIKIIIKRYNLTADEVFDIFFAE